MKNTKFVEEGVIYTEENSDVIYILEEESGTLDIITEVPQEFINEFHINAVQTKHGINTSSNIEEITNSYKIAA